MNILILEWHSKSIKSYEHFVWQIQKQRNKDKQTIQDRVCSIIKKV